MFEPYEAPMPKGGTRIYGGKPREGAWEPVQRRYIVVWRRKTYKVARLVCEAFHGKPPKGKRYCVHVDEDAANNRPENLKWGTQKENLNMPKFIEYCQGRTGKNNPYIKGRRISL